ncbi:MAG TPA: iron-sulfur cluster-binding domain-containing protein [Chitinophagales bacterium]|nr:iron-sulfur cluster-binding domain-containing protein [Chitinophagales bacterium]
MATAILNSIRNQFNKTMFNTDFNSYFSPLVETFHPSKNHFDKDAKVLEISRERNDVISIKLQPSKNWKGFIAGQFIEITLKINAVFYTRTFSISSSISQFKKDKTITLTIQNQDNGKVTNWLINQLKINDTIGISDAKGNFIIANHQDDFLLIAGGLGITPFRSMLYQCIEQNKNVVLLYYCKSNQHIFENELKNLKSDKVKIEFINSDVAGRFSKNHLEKHCLNFKDSQAFICGPAAMIEHSISVLKENNGDENNVHFEYFKKPIANSIATNKKINGKLNVNNKSIEVDNSTSILEHLEANQIQPKYGCRMGLCKQCTCTKKSGIVFNQLTQKYSQDTEEEIQICVSVPIGEISINL